MLFLHGLAGHRDEWRPIVDLLDADVGIVIPDQRAHGTSCGTEDLVLDRSSYVQDAVTLIEQSLASRVIVVGHSMGGIVATLLAHARPDLVQELVLIETGMNAVGHETLSDLARWFETWPDNFVDRAEAANFFGPTGRSTPAWIDGLEESPTGLTRRFQPRDMVATMRSLGGLDRWKQWEDITAPTVLLQGSSSAISDGDMKRMLTTGPKTDLIVVDNSCHDVHLDQPERVASVLTERLGSK